MEKRERCYSILLSDVQEGTGQQVKLIAALSLNFFRVVTNYHYQKYILAINTSMVNKTYLPLNQVS
jgi:hypothetical protein